MENESSPAGRHDALRVSRARAASWWMLGSCELDTLQTLQLTDNNASLTITEVTFLLPTHFFFSIPPFLLPLLSREHKTSALTWLEMSHSGLFSGSTPPTHFTKSREDYNPISILFSPRNEGSHLIHSTRVQSSTAKMLITTKSLDMSELQNRSDINSFDLYP